MASPLQIICRKRFILKGQITSTLGLINYIIGHSKITKNEFHSLIIIRDELYHLSDNFDTRTSILKDELALTEMRKKDAKA